MQRAERLKVLVGLPSMGSWGQKSGMCLLAMNTHFWTMRYPYGSKAICYSSKVGSILPNSRQEIMKEAIKEDCTHLLFIDTDQSFPPELLYNLLSWNKPVIGCNIATKVLPSQPSARRLGNKPVFTTPFDTGIEQVWRLGTGIMLIDVSILDRVPYPWFTQRWDAKRDSNVGEDWYFNEQLEAAGIPIFIDQALSYRIGHVGEFEYTHDAVPVPREVMHEKGIRDDMLSPDVCIATGQRTNP